MKHLLVGRKRVKESILKKMVKKSIAVVMAAVLLFSIAGCGKNEEKKNMEERITITYGGSWIRDDIKEAVLAFNQSNRKYQIVIKDYSEEEEPELKMTTDIVAGNIPDIIDLVGVSVEQYIAKGILEDLTSYYEKDSEISTDDILDSVLEAMKTDGKIYYVTPGFSISTIVARTADVGDGTGWTFDELKAFLEKKKDGVRLFWSENKRRMLMAFLRNGVSDFVDWQTGECRFNSQDFKDILEICNSRGSDEGNNTEDFSNRMALLQEGKILFEEGRNGGSFSPEDMELYGKLFGEDITCIGYPNKEKEGNYFDFGYKAGIYAKSEVKDAAWEFIRTFMTKEYQGYYEENLEGQSPVRKDCFDMMMKGKTATEVYVDEFGREISPLDIPGDWIDTEIEMEPLSEREADMYINLVNNTKRVRRNDYTIVEIIQEEAEVYFAGEKSLDDIADIIQNRIRIYVNENR